MSKKAIRGFLFVAATILAVAIPLAGCDTEHPVAVDTLPQGEQAYFDYALDGQYTVTEEGLGLIEQILSANVAGHGGSTYTVRFLDADGNVQEIVYTEYGGAEPLSMLRSAVDGYVQDQLTMRYSESLDLDHYLTKTQIERTGVSTYLLLFYDREAAKYSDYMDIVSSVYGIKLDAPLDEEMLYADFGMQPRVYLSTHEILTSDDILLLENALNEMYEDTLSRNRLNSDFIKFKLEMV
ncbi:MAG: hypothetical protein LBN36_09320 [Clostridiales Family XIII bacterium]|jgi:hypothetical protein|nr:hypothetical protein [Clostridiales Family XIII bacterium]